MRIESLATGAMAIGLLLSLVSIPSSAEEITVHRTWAGLFEFGTSGYLHPDKATITRADQGINPHRHQGTIRISGLGEGYENLVHRCEGARLRNFSVGMKPPANHLNVGVCTVFRGDERIGTLSYNGTEGEPGATLYLEYLTCELVGAERVTGEGNSFTPALAPVDQTLLGGTYSAAVVETYRCTR